MATDPSQMTHDQQVQAVQAMHDEMTPEQLRPVVEEHYANMSPDELKAAIAALQSQLSQQQKPETQAIVAKVDAQNPTAQQAADMHVHAQEHHPEVVRNVLIAGAGTAAVAGLAAFAIRRAQQSHQG